jgi:hypothetical protein
MDRAFCFLTPDTATTSGALSFSSSEPRFSSPDQVRFRFRRNSRSVFEGIFKQQTRETQNNGNLSDRQNYGKTMEKLPVSH